MNEALPDRFLASGSVISSDAETLLSDVAASTPVPGGMPLIDVAPAPRVAAVPAMTLRDLWVQETEKAAAADATSIVAAEVGKGAEAGPVRRADTAGADADPARQSRAAILAQAAYGMVAQVRNDGAAALDVLRQA